MIRSVLFIDYSADYKLMLLLNLKQLVAKKNLKIRLNSFSNSKIHDYQIYNTLCTKLQVYVYIVFEIIFLILPFII